MTKRLKKKQQKRERRKREQEATRKEPVYIRVIPDRTVDISITKIAKRIAKQAKNYTSLGTLKYLRRFLRSGLKAANKPLEESIDSNPLDIRDLEFLLSRMCCDAAEAMGLVEKLYPKHAIAAQYIGPGLGFILSVHPLKDEPTPFGTAYYSPHEPRIEIDGQSYIVAFSKHALNRSCERYSDFSSTMDRMLTILYVLSTKKFTWVTYHDRVLVEIFRQESEVFYRWGYCPITLQGRFAVAQTALLTGMKDTPEENIIKEHREIMEINCPWDRAAELNKYRQQIYEEDLDLFQYIAQEPSNYAAVSAKKWKSILK